MFENIIGHEKQKELLKNALKSGNISHSYLFYGQEGIGKAKIAKEFAKELLHVENIESSPDYKYITRREDKKDIIIEQIRKELIDNVYELPVSGEKKVYIIDNAQMLNIASQNALLKTLEEPPKYVVIILISSNISAFLTTIISRVNKISFNGIDDVSLKNFIRNQYNVELKDSIIKFIDGSIGNAIQIVQNNTFEKFVKVDNLYEYICNKDVVSALKVSKEISFLEDNLLDYLEFLLYINFKYQCTKFVEKAKNRLKYNGNYDIVIDNMILKIIDNVI